jgi:hypothetical protein
MTTTASGKPPTHYQLTRQAEAYCESLARYGVSARPLADGTVTVENPDQLLQVLRAARLYDDAVAAGEPLVSESYRGEPGEVYGEVPR